MATTPDLTPYRLVEIDIGTGPVAQFVDITELLGTHDVKVEEGTNVIDKATFKVVHNALEINRLAYFGMPCRITGGFIVDYPLNVRVIFAGIITGWTLALPENGKPEVEIQVEDERAFMSIAKPGYVRYPSFLVSEFGTNCSRPWAVNDPLKISDIVKNIVDEHGITVNSIKINDDLDFSFSVSDPDPCGQAADESDFEFLHRLITGVGKNKFTGVRKGKRTLLSAQAVWFMEYDPIAQQSSLTVVPEADILKDTSPISFLYQGEGLEILPEGQYDPTSQAAVMLIKSATIRQNIEEARAETTRLQKMTQRKAKGPKGAKNTGDKIKGALQGRAQEKQEESAGIDRGPTLDALATGQAAASSFQGKDDKTIAAAAAGATFDSVKPYAIYSQETTHPAASRKLGAKGDDSDDAVDQTKPATPGTVAPPKGKHKFKQKPAPAEIKFKNIGERIKGFGQVISFSCDGNIWIQCRKSYPVDVPAAEYAGDYFCYKLTTILGKKFTQTMELGRQKPP